MEATHVVTVSHSPGSLNGCYWCSLNIYQILGNIQQVYQSQAQGEIIIKRYVCIKQLWLEVSME